MRLKSFSILVPFDGVMTMAEVQEVESPINFFYKVTFQNGYENVFNTFEGEEDESNSGWSEAGLGETQLAKDVGKAINFYVMYETEPTIIEIDEEKYFCLPQPEKDQTFYQVYREKLLCVLSYNSEGQWQADCEIDNALVQKIGLKIETEEI
jgi:hypothetical protein